MFKIMRLEPYLKTYMQMVLVLECKLQAVERYMKIIPVVLMDVLVLEFKLLKEILEEEIRIISQKVANNK